MALYYCKTCNTYQNWLKCGKCGRIYCSKCSTFGKGNYPKMQAINRCIYCGQLLSSGLEKLKGTENELEMLVRENLAKK